mgnify:CR=1 FL=1
MRATSSSTRSRRHTACRASCSSTTSTSTRARTRRATSAVSLPVSTRSCSAKPRSSARSDAAYEAAERGGHGRCRASRSSSAAAVGGAVVAPVPRPAIGANPATASSMALALADGAARRASATARVLVIGAGRIGLADARRRRRVAVVRHLVASPTGRRARAEDVADRFDADALATSKSSTRRARRGLTSRSAATSSEAPVVGAETCRGRDGRPREAALLVIVDLAVPGRRRARKRARSTASASSTSTTCGPGSTRRCRRVSARCPSVEAIVEDGGRGVRSPVPGARGRAAALRAASAGGVDPASGRSSARSAISVTSIRRVVGARGAPRRGRSSKKLLHDPTVRARERAGAGEADEVADAVRDLFGISAPTISERSAASRGGDTRHAGLRRSLRAQTELVIASRWRRRPGLECATQVDLHRRRPDAGERRAAARDRRKGLFTAELERALLATARSTLAVHSLQDLPTEDARRRRGRRRHARVRTFATASSRAQGVSLAELAAGARRRNEQPAPRRRSCRALRPDLEVRSIRGNVDTRMRKVEDGEFDAAVLAAAGVRRLGPRARGHRVAPARDDAAGSRTGALAVQCRAGRRRDARRFSRRSTIRRHVRRRRPSAAFLRALAAAVLRSRRGACSRRRRPLGCVSRDSSHRSMERDVVRVRGEGEPREVGERLAEEAPAGGADRILAAIRDLTNPFTDGGSSSRAPRRSQSAR